jgi:uncharacterized protein with ParB-like and HNH nuclease domain
MVESDAIEGELTEHELDPSPANEVEDDTEADETVPPVPYQITSYGADYDVDGIVKRTKSGDIKPPEFQRNYVWTYRQACRFIESLLLGLPVPGVFLAREEPTGKFLILDGRQRITTLSFFYEGYFNPTGKTPKLFELAEVQKGFLGKTYKTLEDRDRRRLDNGIIHATIVKQESPTEEVDTSLFHIFERLNSGETRITHQEARSAIFHGKLINEIKSLNDYPPWRKIFGKTNRRLKDQELILRFLALFVDRNNYSRPMSEFLNKFTGRNKNANDEFLGFCRSLFQTTIDLAQRSLGDKAFRPERAFNAAVFDSVMVGMGEFVQQKREVDLAKIAEAYNKLLTDKTYFAAISRSTADEAFVSSRLKKAIDLFTSI